MIVVTFQITTTGSGAYTSTTDGGVTGQPSSGAYLLHAVEWVDGSLDNSHAATLSITNTPSGVDKTLLTIAAGEGDDDIWYYPQTLVHDPGAEDTTFYTMQVVIGTLKLAVTSGGASKTGKCLVYLLEA